MESGLSLINALRSLNDSSSKDSVDCVLKLQLIITYSDNSEDIIISDKSWMTAMSATIISSIYNGEIFDENLDESNEVQWNSVMVMNDGDGPPGTSARTAGELWDFWIAGNCSHDKTPAHLQKRYNNQL